MTGRTRNRVRPEARPLPAAAAHVDAVLARLDARLDWLVALSPLDGDALWRAFDARYIPRADGQYYFGFSNSWDFATSLAQDSLRAPSVFNFFEPDYRLQGADGAAGLYAPELQLYNEATFASVFNQLDSAGWSQLQTAPPTANTSAPVLDIRPLLTLAEQDNHGAMVDQVNTLLLAGALTSDNRATMVQMLDRLRAERRPADERVRSLVQLAVASPEFVIQR